MPDRDCWHFAFLAVRSLRCISRAPTLLLHLGRSGHGYDAGCAWTDLDSSVLCRLESTSNLWSFCEISRRVPGGNTTECIRPSRGEKMSRSCSKYSVYQTCLSRTSAGESGILSSGVIKILFWRYKFNSYYRLTRLKACHTCCPVALRCNAWQYGGYTPLGYSFDSILYSLKPNSITLAGSELVRS